MTAGVCVRVKVEMVTRGTLWPPAQWKQADSTASVGGWRREGPHTNGHHGRRLGEGRRHERDTSNSAQYEGVWLEEEVVRVA